MSKMKKPLTDVNLYDLLGISLEADQLEIRKAYRKRALDCHPDKNPDNPQAAERFHELSKALEILTDVNARAAYDKVLKAKKAAELRSKQLDSKRQKLKADLEKRERAALDKYGTLHQKSDEELLQEQIERLRREGSKLLEEEQLAMKEQLKRNYAEHQPPTWSTFDSSQYRIKIKWRTDKEDYTHEQLMQFLKKYGEVEALVLNSKKSGRAMVELKTREACDMVLAYEKGKPTNPLSFEWVKPPPGEEKSKETNSVSTKSSRDYEDLVMRKLRQAEERKRLIEQMLKEED